MAQWDTAFINNLPDMAFAVIKPGGQKDDSGKTVPRTLRMLPHHDSSVQSPNEASSVDPAHLRNALARLSQSDLTPEEMAHARAHLEMHAKQLQVGDYKAFATEFNSLKLSSTQTQFIEIMKVSKGTHPLYGEVEITQEHLVKFQENFENNARQIDIAIDFAHENDKIAAGWFKSVWLSEDKQSLYAEVRWTTEGARAVNDKLYRYFSPEFTFNYVDSQGKSWGPVLLGGGLTNRPFLKDLTPLIQLNEKTRKDNKEMADVIKLQEDLLAAKSEKEAVALKLAAKESDVVKLNEKVTTLENENKKLVGMINLAEKKAAFDKALSEGKFIEAQREVLMKLELETIKQLAEVSKPVLNLDGKGHGNDQSSDSKKFSDAELEFAKKLGVTPEEYAKYN